MTTRLDGQVNEEQKTVYDADMNPLRPATPDEIVWAESHDPDGDPVNVAEEIHGTVRIDLGPIGNYGKGVGRIDDAEGYTKVCVC